MQISFRASEYRQDTSFETADYEFRGSEATGWTVLRNGAVHLELGPGYRLLRTDRCGVCSTDLDRHFLPFPLPQITGHELVALPVDSGSTSPAAATAGASKRFVVEINASHAARGVKSDCPFCSRGLATHCPDRLVLGIHDLPGGFGSWILAPVNAILEIPDSIPSEVAVLVEPFAATLRGVHVTAPRDGDRVAVLGPRRLGMLLVAALAAERKRRGISFELHALVRRRELGELAMQFGADAYALVDESSDDEAAQYDIVFDTTGNPAALEIAARHSTRELHIKSTHGQPSCGLTQLTAMVVDELAIARLPENIDATTIENYSGAPRPVLAWLAGTSVPDALRRGTDVLEADDPIELRPALAACPAIPRADAVVVRATPGAIDAAIRPSAADEQSILRPRGTIWIDPRSRVAGEDAGPLVDRILDQNIRVSTSRCGDFRQALELLASDAELRERISRLVTHQFEACALEEAFATARSTRCIKAVVQHGEIVQNGRAGS